MEKEDNKFDVAVIGAGPAGMMAAGAAAESGAKVILIEKNKQLGRKLLLTGNSRCNITNAEFNLRKLVENYGKDGKFLFHAFFVFGPKKVINFFEGLGVKTKTEKDNRVFPASEKAVDVLNALKRYLEKNNVNISLDSPISRVIFKDNPPSRKASEGQRKIEKLVMGDKEIIAKKYIFCTGGKTYPVTGSTGDGFRWARDLGHSISDLSPALVPIKVKPACRQAGEKWVKDLQGLALKDVKISVLQKNKKHFQEMGDILFTNFGLSGPAILNISKSVGKLLKQGEVKLYLDLFPNLNIEDLDKKIKEKINKNPKRFVRSFLADFMPQRFVAVFIKYLGIDVNKQVNNITKKERKVIAKLFKNIEFVATELLGFDLAMVTSGGVLLKEIDDKTMKSKIIDNLFFAGEIIDVDGKTGGFNLQACWSTGYLAGKSAIN
jgi:hypothetical protein